MAEAVKNDGLSLLQNSVFGRNCRSEINVPMAALLGCEALIGVTVYWSMVHDLAEWDIHPPGTVQHPRITPAASQRKILFKSAKKVIPVAVVKKDILAI